MDSIKNKIIQIPNYFLPSALFFILISSAATNVLIILSVIVSIILCIKNKHIVWLLENKTFFICIILYLAFCVSSLYSLAQPDQVFEVLKKYIKFLYIPFLVYYVRTFDNKDIIIKFFIAGCSIVLFFSYLKYFSIFEFQLFYDILEKLNLADVKEKIIINRTAVFQHYIIQGIVLSFYSFMCLYLGVKKQNIIYYIYSGLAFFNVLFMNDSRTAYILVFCLLLLSLFFILKNVKFIIGFLLIFIVLIFSQFSDNLIDRFKVLNTDINYIAKDNYNSSLGLRFLWAKVGIDNLKNKPFFGHGAGSFKITSENYYKKNNISSYGKYITNNPHNEFISISSQLGLFGLMLYLGFILSLYINNKHNILAIGIIFTIIISSIFNSAFYDNMLGLFLAAIICLIHKNNYKV